MISKGKKKIEMADQHFFSRQKWPNPKIMTLYYYISFEVIILTIYYQYINIIFKILFLMSIDNTVDVPIPYLK